MLSVFMLIVLQSYWHATNTYISVLLFIKKQIDVMLRFHKIFNFINRYRLCQIDFKLDELLSDTGYLSLEHHLAKSQEQFVRRRDEPNKRLGAPLRFACQK